MKNIILQHWTGELRELEKLSLKNIQKYAEFCGAEHRLISDNLFMPHLDLQSQCQKMCMLDERWDEYDYVVMMDADMFTRKGMTKNIFTDANGYGRHFKVQPRLVKTLERNYPGLCNSNYPYWGGSIYRLPRELRQKFRKLLEEKDAKMFATRYHDEGIMHRLAVKAKMSIEDAYLDEQNWNYSSFDEGVENANIIHIRTKIKPEGPKRSKLENYRALVERGLIEE
jgi:hypothetical protein